MLCINNVVLSSNSKSKTTRENHTCGWLPIPATLEGEKGGRKTWRKGATGLASGLSVQKAQYASKQVNNNEAQRRVVISDAIIARFFCRFSRTMRQTHASDV
uniref:Uncharacterized protein n=1 Tax=Oryza sativa subsp. japonica TaxID=39947 RepID=Q7XHZ3_ORYSJ|nr:hypothetical protein [Oryza sativa Japonica Group]